MTGLGEALLGIVSNEALLQSNETATRQAAVLPILAALGWSWFDLAEVEPEYSVRGGRVDYCLKHLGRNLAFIEVKRAGTELGPHQEQLLRYAFEEGVPQAILTDGLVWWFYLPTETGSWEQRRFFALDLRRQSPDAAVRALEGYLGKDAVLSGKAVETAKAELADKDRERRVLGALPTAWRQLLTEPDDLLAELVAETTAGIAGHAPDADVVAEFLLGQLSDAQPMAASNAHQSRTVDDLGRALASAAPLSPPGTFTGRTPRSFTLDGEVHPVSTWREVLLGVCRRLQTQSEERFAAAAPSITGTKRHYFAQAPDGFKYPLALESGWYVEGNLSANDCVRLARRVLTAVRGGPEDFAVELES